MYFQEVSNLGNQRVLTQHWMSLIYFLDDICKQHGLPDIIVSDRDNTFCLELLKRLMERSGNQLKHQRVDTHRRMVHFKI